MPRFVTYARFSSERLAPDSPNNSRTDPPPISRVDQTRYNFFLFYFTYLNQCHSVRYTFFVRFVLCRLLFDSSLPSSASMNGHSYPSLNNMVIGPISSSGTSPGLPLTLDNGSCTPTPNPTISTPSNAGDVEDGSTNNQQTATNLNSSSNALINNNINHHSHHHQTEHHHQHHQQHSAESPNEQSSLIILQPSGVGVTSEISSGTIAGIGGYSSMLPSFSHYAPGKF